MVVKSVVNCLLALSSEDAIEAFASSLITVFACFLQKSAPKSVNTTDSQFALSAVYTSVF